MTATTVAPSLAAAPHPPSGEVVMVTPEIAEQMLAHNTNNRRARAASVAAYAADMEAGDWRWTGDPIRFAADGTLLDGQHRLLGIVQSGQTIPLLVIRGLAREAQENIDAGVPRKYADVLSLRGEPNAAGLAAIVRKVNMWESGSRADSNGGKPTSAQLNRTLEAHPELRDITRSAQNIAGPVGLPASLIGLCWWLFSDIDQEDADFFMQRLADGQAMSSGYPIYELRKQIAASRNHRGERSQKYLLAITIKAWNAFRAGDQIAQLKFRVGGAKPEQFPEPK